MVRYSQERGGPQPKLGSYVDDIFGGFPRCESFGRALDLRRYLCYTGASVTLIFNLKPSKTPLPARKQVILGRLYNSTTRRVRTEQKKQQKYRKKIKDVLEEKLTTVNDIQKLHGYLNYVACVFPFGRPFLAVLATAICALERSKLVRITRAIRSCFEIWDAILAANEGLSYDFILGRLP